LNERECYSMSHRRLFVRLLAFLLSLGFVAWIGTSRATSIQQTEILWDTYGVPHIYAKDGEDLFYAFGWAQMQSHGNLLLRLYGEARGQAAEYWGQDHLELDQWLRTLSVPDRAQSWYKAQSPTFQGYLDAFAAGVNAYAQAHADLIDDEMEVVLPVTSCDLLAHFQRVLYFTFLVNPEQIAELQTDQPLARHTQASEKMGSNGWAIAPSRSASGHAMLLANPHLPWSDFFLWYEAQLTAPDIDAYGATLIGTPVLEIAFNDFLGWTHTINTFDGWDIYELTTTDGGYQFDETTLAFETETQTLKVKQEDGTLREEPLTIRRSIHGPVVAEAEGRVMALRVVGLDQPGALEQWWEMARAHNLAEFEAILQRLQIPMFTILYADRDGHIMHLFNGQVPVRSQGSFDDWSTPIPGDTSATLWTETHPYSDLPRALDPASGWLQNANEAPWTTTFPPVLRPDDYPAYMAPRGPMWFRPQQSARLLEQDPQISFSEFVQYKHSTRMELADRLLDDLIPAARQYGNSLAQEAAEVLAAWDRQAEPESQGAVLFATWAEEVAEAIDTEALFAVPWSEEAPRTTPDGLADPADAVKALEAAASQVESTYGTLDVAWGEQFRLRSGEVDLPANGGPSHLGIFRHLWFAPDQGQSFKAIGGDSFVAAIEFSNPVRAMALTSYGNATQPHSPHRGDQLEWFARQQLRPVWRSRSEIEAHLVSRQTLDFLQISVF
jgi:acyl-homoserine-lactone acylase